MIEADNEVSRKLGFRVNKSNCKEGTNTEDSTGTVSNSITIDFDGADVLKAIQNGFDGTSKWKDSGVNQIGSPNAVTTSYSTLDDDNDTSFCIFPNPFKKN